MFDLISVYKLRGTVKGTHMTFTAAEKLAEIEHHLKVCQEVEHDTGGLGLFQKRISRLAAIAEDYRKLVAEDQAARRKSA